MRKAAFSFLLLEPEFVHPGGQGENVIFSGFSSNGDLFLSRGFNCEDPNSPWKSVSCDQVSYAFEISFRSKMKHRERDLTLRHL